MPGTALDNDPKHDDALLKTTEVQEQERRYKLGDINQRQRLAGELSVEGKVKGNIEVESEVTAETNETGGVSGVGQQSQSQEFRQQRDQSDNRQPSQSQRRQPDNQAKPEQNQEQRPEDQNRNQNQDQEQEQKPEDNNRKQQDRNKDQDKESESQNRNQDKDKQPEDQTANRNNTKGDGSKDSNEPGSKKEPNRDTDDWMDKHAKDLSPEERERFKALADSAPIAETGADALAGEAGVGAGVAAGAGETSVVAEAGVGVAASTWEIWGPTLLIILGIILLISLVLFIFTALVAKCNEDTWTGTGVRAASKVASWVGIIPADVCEKLAISGTPPSGGAGATGSYNWEPTDLVALSGVTIDPQTSDPRVRQCMLPKAQQIFSAARAAGLDIAVTSAFRSGGFPSRHAFGEALDLVIRPTPAQPWRNNQQIAKLVQIGINAGFTEPVGDTLDEYNQPTEQATGGHVHVEFNKTSVNGSYCAPYPDPPAPL